MRALYEQENFLGFGLSSLGSGKLHELLQKALHTSHSLSLDDTIFNFMESPVYKTQMPYFSGYMQDRYVYNINLELCDFLESQWKDYDSFDAFMNEYLCWDIYKNNQLVLSMNVVMQIIYINKDIVDMSEYGYTEED